MTPDTYYDKIYCINLTRRPDRWAQCVDEFAKYGITKYERWQASEGFNDDGTPHGNKGCTLSHRKLLQHIAENFSPEARILVLEDDFQIVSENFDADFQRAIEAVPQDADIVYLGAHYKEKPQYRVNAHCIRTNGILTTSSFGITGSFAGILSGHMEGEASKINPGDPLSVYLRPIDNLFSELLPSHKSYCVQPRLMVQRPSFSDLQEKWADNRGCMLDGAHEALV